MLGKLRENPLFYLFKKHWEYSTGNRKKVAIFSTMFVIANAIDVLRPMIVYVVFNRIQQYGINKENVWNTIWILALIPVSSVVFWLFHGPARVLEQINAFLVRINYKLHIVDGTMSLPMEWHTEHHSGDTIDKIAKGVARLESFSEEMTCHAIEAVVRLTGAFVALIYFNPSSCWVAVVTIILTLTIIARFDKVLVGMYFTLSKNENLVAEKVHDAITNIATVITLRIEKPLMKSIERKIKWPYSLFKKNVILNETKWFVVSLLGNIMVFLVIATYIYKGAYSGEVLVGTIFALYGYVGRINEIFFSFARLYGNLVKQKVSVLNAEEIVNDFSQIEDSVEPSSISHWRKLDIEDLSFSYHSDDGQDLHLDNVSMEIKRGQNIAVIGDSGAGKSTFLRLMRDLYQPSRVRICCDGRPLENGFADISHEITLIPQNPEIFKETIEKNITLGIETNPEDLQKVIEMSCIGNVIESLPHGIQSSIKEKGVNLSGGEVQRLALARGLLASLDKSIVLLDEPTSSVDSTNEMAIYANILREFKDKTIISSIHKLHLLSLFDLIYFFKDGQIIASGTLQELLLNCSEFAILWQNYHEQIVEENNS